MGKLAQLGGQFTHFVEYINLNSSPNILNVVPLHPIPYIFFMKYFITWIRNGLQTVNCKTPEKRMIFSN